MTLTTLLRQPTATPAILDNLPTIGDRPVDQVVAYPHTGRVVLERAIVDDADPILSDKGTWTFKVPATSPGYAVLVAADGSELLTGPYCPPVEWICDGYVMGRGVVVSHQADHATGWATITVKDPAHHLDNNVLGDPPINLLGDEMTWDTTDGDPLTDWIQVNATARPHPDTAGTHPSLQVKERAHDDAGNSTESNVYRSIHRNVNVGASDQARDYFGSVWVKVPSVTLYNPFSRTARYWTDSPTPQEGRRTALQLAAQYPDDIPRDVWFRVEFPKLTVAAGREAEVRHGHWTARKGGPVRFSVAQLFADAGLTVPPGSTSATLVQQAMEEGFAAVGIGTTVVLVSASTAALPDGFRLPYRQHDNPFKVIGDRAAEVEYRYAPNRDEYEVAGTGGLGRLRQDVIAGIDSNQLAQVLTSVATADGLATDVIAQLAGGGDSTEELQVTTDREYYARWRKVVQAPEGALPKMLPDVAAQALTAAQHPTIEHSITLKTPPGGRVPDDWLRPAAASGIYPARLPLELGDTFKPRIIFGPADITRTLRFVGFHVTPGDGRKLTATVKAVPE